MDSHWYIAFFSDLENHSIFQPLIQGADLTYPSNLSLALKLPGVNQTSTNMNRIRAGAQGIDMGRPTYLQL